MKYTKIYDKTYKTLVIGYKPVAGGYSIFKDARYNYSGNEIIDGWEVYDAENFWESKRIFYAATLKEAKEFIESRI